MGLPKEEVIFALNTNQDPDSFFEPVYSEGADAIFGIASVSYKKNTDNRYLKNRSITKGLKRLVSAKSIFFSCAFLKEKRKWGLPMK